MGYGKAKEHLVLADDDLIARYLLLTHRHDGTGAIQVKFTPVRVVCQNTLNQALSEGPSFRVSHTKSMYARLDKAAEALREVLALSRKVDIAFQRMVAVEVKTEQRLHAYLKAVFPDPDRSNDERQYEKALLKAQRNRKASLQLFESGKGNGLPGVKGTLWAAYNGVAEHSDYGLRGSRDSKWLDSVWFGESYRIKTRAFDAAQAIIQSGQTAKAAVQ